MKKIVMNIVSKIEEKREKEKRHKEIRAHIIENKRNVEEMKAREKYYKQLLDERAEKLSKQAEAERRMYLESLFDKKIKEKKGMA